MPWADRRTASSPSSPVCTAPKSVLCTIPSPTALTRDRPAECRGGAARLRWGRGTHGLDQRDAPRLEQPGDLGVREPALALAHGGGQQLGRLSRAGVRRSGADRRAGPGATRPAGPPPPGRAPRPRDRRTRAAPPPSRFASVAPNTTDTIGTATSRATASIASWTASAVALERGSEERHQRIDLARARERAQHRVELLGAGGRQHVDRVARRRVCRQVLGQPRAQLLGRLREHAGRRPRRRRRTGSRGPRRWSRRPTRRPLGRRLGREQRADVEQLAERVRSARCRPGRRAPRFRRRTPRPPRRCERRRRAPPRRTGRLSARRSACGAPAGARCARSCAGCRTTPGRRAPRRSSRRPPSTRARRWRRCPAGCRSRRTRTGRGRVRPACSIRASPTPPLCESRATRPGGAAWGTKVASSGLRRPINPRQFGPTRRMPAARQIATSSSCSTAPSAPASANPADRTSSALHPAHGAVAGHVRHALGRTATTASSGASGSSDTEA